MELRSRGAWVPPSLRFLLPLPSWLSHSAPAMPLLWFALQLTFKLALNFLAAR